MAFKTTANDEASKTILAAHSGLLTAENVEIVLSEPRLFLPLLFCLTLVVSSIVTAYACYKRVVAKYTVFNSPTGGAPVLQYQTVQGPYGVLEREYCVLQQKLYGAAGGGYYGMGKNGEMMYDMPYDAVISTSLPVHNAAAAQQIPESTSADTVAALAPKDCYTMLKGKDNRQSCIVAPAVPEKDEALRATLRAEKAMKIRKELQEARANGTIIQADIHSSDDYVNDESEAKDGTFIQPTENSDPEDTDNDGDDMEEPENHTEPTELGNSSTGDSNPDVKGDTSDRMDATELLMKSPSDTAVIPIEPEPAPPALPAKMKHLLPSPTALTPVPFSVTMPTIETDIEGPISSTTPIHIVPDLPSPPVDDYDVNWPAPPPPEGLE